MKYLPFLVQHLRFNWIRTTSTVVAMALSVFLFCTLRTLVDAVSWNLQSVSASRLVTRHGVGLVLSLPLSYGPKIAAVPGVRSVALTDPFGGIYRDFKNYFPTFAVEAEPYLAMYPEYVIPEADKRVFLQDTRGCVVGRDTARRFGWKKGDVFQMESFIPPFRTGKPFEFVVRAIYDTDDARHPGTDGTAMLFHFKYLYEATGRRAAAVLYTVEIADPARAGEVSKAVDALFANSEAQTRTGTEAAFRASFVSLAGNLALLLNVVGLAVAFTLLVVTANTMSMTVRERRTEIAVLKTLGFSNGRVMGLIVSEGLLLGAVGGGLGVLLGGGTIRALPGLPIIGDAVRGFPALGLSPAVGALGVGLALSLGLAAALVPALFAYRARVTEMLRPV